MRTRCTAWLAAAAVAVTLTGCARKEEPAKNEMTQPARQEDKALEHRRTRVLTTRNETQAGRPTEVSSQARATTAPQDTASTTTPNAATAVETATTPTANVELTETATKARARTQIAAADIKREVETLSATLTATGRTQITKEEAQQIRQHFETIMEQAPNLDYLDGNQRAEVYERADETRKALYRLQTNTRSEAIKSDIQDLLDSLAEVERYLKINPEERER
ncbi:MAG: hypothetical protein N2111_11490 [Candidatus Sumerlaeaceae bacterium]|nr:hypothetical protein [Candidatus Sumerlaeaceae bacterium]